MQYFGKIFREARIAKDLTREELSVLSGLSEATILACERSRYIPSITTLSALSKHIDIIINRLAPELEKEKKRRRREKKYPRDSMQKYWEEAVNTFRTAFCRD